MFPDDIRRLAEQTVRAATDRGVTLATAESCTGGLIAAALTGVAGASAALDRGFVTYSNAAKTALLGVETSTLARHGAVSEATARAMAEGARSRSGASLAISVTGIAGPGGGSETKPVGRVHLGLAHCAGTDHVRHDFPGDRDAVRLAATRAALSLVLDHLS